MWHCMFADWSVLIIAYSMLSLSPLYHCMETLSVVLCKALCSVEPPSLWGPFVPFCSVCLFKLELCFRYQCVLYSAALFSFIKSVNLSSSLVRLRESPARYYRLTVLNNIIHWSILSGAHGVISHVSQSGSQLTLSMVNTVHSVATLMTTPNTTLAR